MTHSRGEYAPKLSRSSSGGDQRLGNSSVSSQRSHGTKSSKADSGSQATHRSTPTRSHPGIWLVSMGFRLSATDQEALPFSPNLHWVILPWARYCRIDLLGLSQNARWKDLPLATGLTGQLRKGRFSSHRSADQCTLNILPQRLRSHQHLDKSELHVHNSPVRPVQLEQNVHESPDNMPSVKDEHTSEHSQAFQGLLNSDSPDDRADGSPDQSTLHHSGRRSDYERSVHRSVG